MIKILHWSNVHHRQKNEYQRAKNRYVSTTKYVLPPRDGQEAKDKRPIH